MILCFQTYRSGQTVQTQIRLLLDAPLTLSKCKINSRIKVVSLVASSVIV